jgi:AbrB family looped-hinge helix DNA binding protein
MKVIKVSEKGQIAIPRVIREEMGISYGDELLIIQSEGKILLEKMQSVEKKIKDDFKDVLSLSEKSLRKVWDNEEDDIWSEYLK